MMILEDGPLFIADTHVWTLAHARTDRAGGDGRRPARRAVSASSRGWPFAPSRNSATEAEGSGKRLREALEILDARECAFAYEGEMNIDAALDPQLRARLLPGGRLDGPANVLIFGHADAASATRNVLKMKAGGLEVGPILMGMGNRAHVVAPGITARGLLNMAAIAGTPVDHYG